MADGYRLRWRCLRFYAFLDAVYIFCRIGFVFGIYFDWWHSNNGRYFVLYIVLILNVLILPIDPVFNSKTRLLLFIIVTVVVSSAFTTMRAVVFRNMVFKNILILCSILVPISCLFRFLGLNYARMVVFSDMSMQEQVASVGLFGGVFQHSMMLGPIAAVVAVYFFLHIRVMDRRRFILFCSLCPFWHVSFLPVVVLYCQ